MNGKEEFDEKIKRMMKETGWDQLNEEELVEAVDQQLEAMIKLGYVEQLIGEDGRFYYRPARFEFCCPNCGHLMNLPTMLVGKLGRCAECSKIVPIINENP